MSDRFDVVVIGAGVIGSAIARVLSRHRCRTAVVEKCADVAAGASSRNSGVIHAGINCRPGTLRARFCMEGRQLLQEWCRELNVPMSICGKLIVARSQDDLPSLHRLKLQGEMNGVPRLRIISGQQAAALQPGIECVAALHVPTSGIVSPYALTIAMAEDAAVNGVRFFLEREVTGIEADRQGFTVRTMGGDVRGTFVVNCAGINSSQVARSLDPDAPAQFPCLGEYLILDKEAGERMAMSVYPAPRVDNASLGAHITPTTEGNILLGPSSEYVTDPETTWCTATTTERLLEATRQMWPELPEQLVIGAYAGVRAKLNPPDLGGFADFLFRRTPGHPRALHLIGMESPGLTAAPAIAHTVVDTYLRPELSLEEKSPRDVVLRRWPTRFSERSEEEKERLVREDPSSGDIICRCEGVTRSELLHALNNPLGVNTLAGIKFRCGAMMGRCSGGYCLPQIVEVWQDELGREPGELKLRGRSSPAFVGRLLEEGDGEPSA